MPFLDDLERGEELATEKTLPAAEARQRCQRGQQWAGAEVAPVIALNTPHRHHGRGIDTILGLHTRQHRRPLRQHGLPVGHTLVIDQCGEIVPDRGDELGLGIEKADHRHVGREPGGVGIERFGAHPFGHRLATQSGEAGGERRLVRMKGEGH